MKQNDTINKTLCATDDEIKIIVYLKKNTDQDNLFNDKVEYIQNNFSKSIQCVDEIFIYSAITRENKAPKLEIIDSKKSKRQHHQAHRIQQNYC